MKRKTGGLQPAGFALSFYPNRYRQNPGVSAPVADLLSCDDKKVGKETYRLAAGTLVAVGCAENRSCGMTVGPLLKGLAFRF